MFEFDPERALWRPGRRVFVFMLGGAVAGALVPAAEPVSVIEYLAEIAPAGLPRPRVPYVDPRKLWQATMQELHGNDSLSRELGLETFRDAASRRAALVGAKR